MFETLEQRTLMSTAPVPVPPADAVIAMGRDGVVTVKGGNHDNQYSVVRNTHGNIAVTVTQFNTTTRYGLTTDLSSGETFNASYKSRNVRSVLILGGAGNDAVMLDDATQALTIRRSVEFTAIHTVASASGPTRWIDQPFYAAIPGQYGGSTQMWIDRSAAQIKASAVARANADVILLGDSLLGRFTETGAEAFKKFDRFNPLDLGLVGDSTNQILYRIEYQNLLTGIHPKVIVMNVGTNNIGLSDDYDGVFIGVKEVMLQIHQRLPNTKILISSILPRNTSYDNRVVNRVNDRLSTSDNGNSIRYLDVTSTFTRGHAKYYRRNDIHLNAHGYEAWEGLIEPLLAEMYGAT